MASKKKIAAIVTLVIGLLVVETGREVAVFLSWTRYYEKAYWRIEERRHQEDPLTKSELNEIAGPPSATAKDGVESWTWDAAKHIGPVLRLIHLPLTKQPYRLSVEFNSDGFVNDVYANAD